MYCLLLLLLLLFVCLFVVLLQWISLSLTLSSGLIRCVAFGPRAVVLLSYRRMTYEAHGAIFFLCCILCGGDSWLALTSGTWEDSIDSMWPKVNLRLESPGIYQLDASARNSYSVVRDAMILYSHFIFVGCQPLGCIISGQERQGEGSTS